MLRLNPTSWRNHLSCYASWKTLLCNSDGSYISACCLFTSCFTTGSNPELVDSRINNRKSSMNHLARVTCERINLSPRSGYKIQTCEGGPQCPTCRRVRVSGSSSRRRFCHRDRPLTSLSSSLPVGVKQSRRVLCWTLLDWLSQPGDIWAGPSCPA